METPSSTRRVTRSQTLAALNSAGNGNISVSKRIEDSGKVLSKSRQRSAKQQQDRSALIDITNDSPIVGLAMDTPSSTMSKKNYSRVNNTPGSGERLLRGQVKTLLQRVEEEAELTKVSNEPRPFIHLVNSPMGLLAPTPANTPQIPSVSCESDSFGCVVKDIVIASPVVEEKWRIALGVGDTFQRKRKEEESEKSLSITRSLLLDFWDKSDISDSSECSSVLTHKGQSGSKEKSPSTPDDEDDDDSSIWSMQVNASSRIEGNDDGQDDDKVASFEEEEEDCEDLTDELCEGVRTMSVREKTMAKFAGKHTRFAYNSDDEIVDQEEQSPGVLCLKGLPTPKGKHFRFDAEEAEVVSGN